MDVYTAFLVGVLVGHWILFFGIWKAVNSLVNNILHSLESEAAQDNSDSKTSVRLLDDGKGQPKGRYDWLWRQNEKAQLLQKACQSRRRQNLFYAIVTEW
jgi:hypothetical protein